MKLTEEQKKQVIGEVAHAMLMDNYDFGVAVGAFQLKAGLLAESGRIDETTNRGNMAKLREALETCLCLFETIPHVLVGTTVREKVEAALAEPPRNCDKHGGDYKMLHTAWFDWAGSPSGQNANGTAKLTFGKWLLAPANKEGGET